MPLMTLKIILELLEKLSPLIECKARREKTGHTAQQATIYFSLLNAGTLVYVFVIFLLDMVVPVLPQFQ